MPDDANISPEDLKQLIDWSEKMRSSFSVAMQGLGDLVTQMDNIHMMVGSDSAGEAERAAIRAIAKARA